MKNIYISFLTIISCLCILLTGCKHKEEKFDIGLLWKISGNGLKEPSYILGIDNLINVNFLGRVKGFQESLDSTKVLVREIAVTEDQNKWASDTIQEISAIKLGNGYKERLSETDYMRLDKALGEVFKSRANDMKDLCPNLLLSNYNQLNYYSTDSSYNFICHESMEFYLDKIAKNKGMEVIGLESLNENIDKIIGSDYSFDNETKSLISCLENKDLNKKDRSEYNTYYKEQSLAKISNLFNESSKRNSGQTLLSIQGFSKDARTADWLKKLPEILKLNSNFIAVKAFYLAGDSGLLVQLAKMGYTIERVQ